MAAAVCLGILPLSGCGGPVRTESGDSLLDVQDEELTVSRRERAIDLAWANVESGVADRGLTRRALAEDVIWDRGTHPSLRKAAMRALLSDRTEAGEPDSIELCAALLPTESDRDLVELISKTAASRGWTGLTPSLVRSLSTHVPRVEDATRPEAAALRALHPGRSLEQTVFETFLQPVQPGADADARRLDRIADRRRGAAWDLLARLDPTGARRMDLVRQRLGRGSDDPVLLAVAACVDELGCVPLTGDELRWVVALHDTPNQDWWTTARSNVGRLSASQREGLRVRHLEPLRWTAARESSRLNESRDTLLRELDARLADRTLIQRTADSGPFGRNRGERLRDQAGSLRWADLITILAIDDAIASSTTRRALHGQAEADHADDSTEYGGALEPVADGGMAYRAIPYLPRPTQREHDRKYIPPIELIEGTNRALAHYHFHAHRENNESFAGPGEGDLLYAARSGRSCLVFTSIRGGGLAVDYFQPNGVVVDLGVLPR
ncbi:MAG: hypothetical protein AAGK04_05535 [Planctomycetota bacterium]